MTERNQISKKTVNAPQTRQTMEQTMRPAVDIFEDDGGVTVHADLPGVSRESLDIEIEQDTLSIEGQVETTMPKGLEAHYADIRSTRYQRSFTLSHELDGDKAEASLKDGVLKLHIPKRAQYQPRKIEVRAS